ncbi:DUF2256 domain-containing protein [Psychrobacter sp. GW64-MNA-CIBAN-0177]
MYLVCQRYFRWSKDWEQVIYCSEKCRRGKGNTDN